jgi:hypothetical protein
MRFNKFLLACALTIRTRAQGDPTDPAIAGFNSYAVPGCREHLQSNYTIVQTQDSLCYYFTPPFPTTIQSAYISTIIHGCVGMPLPPPPWPPS